MIGSQITGVVLAAGFGTRLRPSTEICPKPLIPVAGVEPLFFALYQLKRIGVKKVVVNAHYLPEKIEKALRDWAPLFKGIEIRISIESPKILGTGGAILKIIKEHKDLFQDRSLLLQNGDTLASFDITRLLESPGQSSFAISFRKDHLTKYKPLWVDTDQTYTGIGPKAPTPQSRPAHFLGVHHICRKDLATLQSLNRNVEEIDLFNGVYKPLGDEGAVFHGVEFFAKAEQDFWFDMTNSEFLLEAQRFILDSMAATKVWPKILKARYPGIREVEPGVWVLSRDRGTSVRQYCSPAVFIENSSSAFDREIGSLVLGPHASLIHGQGLIQSGGQETRLEIKDSVVLLSTEKKSSLPTKIEGEVRVL